MAVYLNTSCRPLSKIHLFLSFIGALQYDNNIIIYLGTYKVRNPHKKIFFNYFKITRIIIFCLIIPIVLLRFELKITTYLSIKILI